MNSKKIIFISVLVVLFVSLSSVLILAETGGSKDNTSSDKEKQSELAALKAKVEKYKEIKATREAKPLTEEQKAYEAKLAVIREDVWHDIINTCNIDSDSYLVLESDQFNAFFNGEIDGFGDKEFLKQIQPIINKYYFNLSIGSTRPFVLIEKDLSEVAVAYKDKDANNHLYTAKKQKDNWEETSVVKKGKAKLNVDDIK